MEASKPHKGMLVVAWGVVLGIALAKPVLQEILGIPVSESLQYAIWGAIVAAALALTLFWQALRPLRPFAILFVVFIAVDWFVHTRLDQLPLVNRLLNDPSFSVAILAEKLLNLIVALVVIGVLFLLKRNRNAFFLAKGDTSAPVEPVPWLGVKRGETWKSFGRNLSWILSLGTLAFLVIAGRPPLDLVARVLPFLPVILLVSALNAFNEEVTYKASFLSVLEGPLGKAQALGVMAAFFGILHFYGVPYGVVGVLMAGFLGWLLGKSMLETRGMFWAWFLHLIQDVWIFAFLAIGSIRAGG